MRSIWSIVVTCLTLSLWAAAESGMVLRREVATGAMAEITLGRQRIGLQVSPPPGAGKKRFFQNFLVTNSDWQRYEVTTTSFIPFAKLNAETKRTVLLSLFEDDVIDAQGWTHVVVDDSETLYSLCEWITGKGNNFEVVRDDSRNDLSSGGYRQGKRVLVPYRLLLPAMRRPTPVRVVEAPPEIRSIQNELAYGSDKEGSFAVYHLKKGEALFSSVAMRFTDFRETEDVLDAVDLIKMRSNIRDVRDIANGQKILIPVSMLSAQYQPRGSEGRDEYADSLREAARFKITQANSPDLSDVVVILDPGHGGTDPGSTYPSKVKNSGSELLEDEINYDIVCRIKKVLEETTGARVYVTMRDRSQGYTPSTRRGFHFDKDEELLTRPAYPGTNPDVSVNLRYMLVNSIYQRELSRGVDSRKIVFTSIHTDSLAKSSRGAMVYIPGARWRRSSEVRSGAVYARYEEGRKFNRFSSNNAERKRDEALSRNFASVLIDELGRHRVKRHLSGDPIRSQINRSGKKPMVPGVLRNTKVPTKILLETANINNSTDRQRLADPEWRQMVADAYVSALKVHYGVTPKLRTARSGG